MEVKLILLVAWSLIDSLYGSPSSDMAALHSDYFAWQMSEKPVSASYNGIHTYGDQLESFNMTKMETRKAKADGFYERLKKIKESELSKDEKVNYKILEDMLLTYTTGYKWRFSTYLNPVNMLSGPQMGLGGLVVSYNTVGDFENYISRLRKLPQQFAEYRALMEEAIKLGRTNHYHSMSRVEEQFQNILVPANESSIYSPFLGTLDNSTVDEDRKEDIRTRGLQAVTDVLDALESFWAFIKDEYMKNTRPEIGITSLDDGKELYEACIKWHLSVDMTAQQVHDKGLEEVNRIVKEMEKVMKRQGFEGTVAEYFQTIMNDTRFFFDTKEEIMDTYRNMINDVIGPKLETYFTDLPGLPIVVREMTYDGPLGAYSSGAADGSRPGVFWANVRRPHETPNLTMMALTAHEADPGHHLQISYSITADTPPFRQKIVRSPTYQAPYGFPPYTSYVEGWALYAEYLGEEMGIYRDDYELMGRYSSEIFRACRLVVDTGIHALGWTREKAIQYMLNYTAEGVDATTVEIDRYITWPGQALAYKIGEIKMRELRDKAQSTLGNRFDIKEFHTVILENGLVPLSVLEELVDDWLNTRGGLETTTAAHTCGTTVMFGNYIIILITVLLSTV